jgi:hypothetical protein
MHFEHFVFTRIKNWRLHALYEYQCLSCLVLDTRIAGIDDYLAICHQCGNVMLRVGGDFLEPYFAPESEVEISLTKLGDHVN